MPVHTVRQGECLSSIANQYGFFWETLWNHERNASLRERRLNPNVILPGDQVFVPEKRQKEESGSTGQTHVFRLKGVPAKFVVKLRDLDGSPRAGLRYTLDVDGSRERGTSDEDGKIFKVIPPSARHALLTVHAEGGDEEYEFDLGNLNPVDVTSGVKARLLNLGYFDGDVDNQMDDATREAIRRFQVDSELDSTGEMDEATQRALVEAHGS